MKRNNKKGFTIVELVIVIAVIGILAAVLIPTFSNAIAQANASAELQEARNAQTLYLSNPENVKTLGSGKVYVVIGSNYYGEGTDGFGKITKPDYEAADVYITEDGVAHTCGADETTGCTICGAPKTGN